MRFDVITLFPEWISGFADQGVTGRALESGKASLQCWNPRDYTSDVHRTVDDRPYGGGPGMVMLAEPLTQAIESAKVDNAGPVVYLSPQGEVFDQGLANEFAQLDGMTLICGRYEGVDERVIQSHVDREVSIGDYVLSGGELGAMVMMDSIIRLLPGVLGHSESAEQDSFMNGLLDCPHYTRPEEFNDQVIPDVLKSGDHERIRRWRLKQALQRTLQRRPDLLQNRELSREEADLLSELRNETEQKTGD